MASMCHDEDDEDQNVQNCKPDNALEKCIRLTHAFLEVGNPLHFREKFNEDGHHENEQHRTSLFLS